MARKWFQLVTKDGNAVTSADAVVVDIEDVAAFRDAVKEEYKDSHLAGIAASDLKVFANGVALEEDSLIGSFGGSMKEALIVVVPTQLRSGVAIESVEALWKNLLNMLEWKEAWDKIGSIKEHQS